MIGPPASRIAATVLNYRTPDETLLAVKSLLASRRPIDDVIVVNNDSTDDTQDALKDVWPKITYIHNGNNLGFSGGTNVGIRAALARGADRILLVNSDVIVPPDTVEHLERCLDTTPEAGIAGPMVLARSEPIELPRSACRIRRRLVACVTGEWHVRGPVSPRPGQSMA
jgi:GT2 family glycosyltransferase